ncbi:uncharacterized protein LOC143228212 [Tachypleus tridentatus]|uniref:uncharacterized protein LOC143228212 n=1 Tax=Tachypleus tridentatus TaxID=6853 RepID=UPI003FD5FB06
MDPLAFVQSSLLHSTASSSGRCEVKPRHNSFRKQSGTYIKFRWSQRKDQHSERVNNTKEADSVTSTTISLSLPPGEVATSNHQLPLEKELRDVVPEESRSLVNVQSLPSDLNYTEREVEECDKGMELVDGIFTRRYRNVEKIGQKPKPVKNKKNKQVELVSRHV